MPGINDRQGGSVPAGLPEVIDAHVHVFPARIFTAVRRWFAENAWPIRYQLSTTQVFDFLLSRGVKHLVALQYAHRPGIAGTLNRYLAGKCAAYPGLVTGLATVFPGEDYAVDLLQEAFDLGLSGVKLHVHVQCLELNAREMDPLYQLCAARGKPMLIHAGREPKSEAYNCDPHKLCRADKVETVLNNFKNLKICIPHLGFDEISAYRGLIERYDTLWLDTTMILADYFPLGESVDLRGFRADRIMYGSDFPNIPYAWDRELKRFPLAKLSVADLKRMLCQNARNFFNIK
ncbi:MAG: amidohydrolase family protein [Thermodesulfobacteriota bacterium]